MPSKKSHTSKDFFQWLKNLVDAGDPHLFYVSSIWLRKRDETLKRDRYECQICKARGRYRRADLVHHVNHVKDRPDLALSDEYIDGDGVTHRQLISVCRACHETVCHPENLRRNKPVICFTTEERWD